MFPAKLNLTNSAPIAAPIPALSYNRINSVVIPVLALLCFFRLRLTPSFFQSTAINNHAHACTVLPCHTVCC